MTVCPLCKSETHSKFPNSPYWMCGNCDLWFQDPLPPKLFQAANELDEEGNAIGHLMSDHDKEVNKYLASRLVDMAGVGRSLDIGSKFPYLAHCLKNLGCDAFGMDGIKEVPEYSKALGVPMLLADFEALPEDQIREWTHTERFNLVTMVHVFEHMYHPQHAIKKLKQLVSATGKLFLRVPDHGVDGFQAHMEPHHFSIHPFFWSLPSMLELLKQTKDTFTVEETNPLSGGQRDFLLRPLAKAPQLWCGMIVKNEERDLPKCLASIENVVDGLVLVDTGSTDKTLEVAEQFGKPKFLHTYLDASKQDDTGDWKLWDFGKARNRFVDMIDKIDDATHLIWMDADDTLLTPENVRRAIYLDQYEVFGMMIESNGMRWVHHRMWKTRKGIQFRGRVHEYPDYGGRPGITLTDNVIRHDGAPGFGESSNQRNLRILLEEVQEAPTPRNTFYLANTHKDAGRWEEAIPVYAQRIAMGEHYRDEWLFAYLYKCRCERSAGRLADAENSALEAASHAPSWAEFWMELAFVYYQTAEWEKALGACSIAKNCISEPTQLWREHNMYTDQPLRLMSFCAQNLGDMHSSLKWAREAKVAIGASDLEWEDRITHLEQTVALPELKPIALIRPGALGDIIMTLQLIPLLKELNPGRKIHYYCHRSYLPLLHNLMTQAGVDNVYDSSQIRPDPTFYHKVVNLVGYPIAEGYPEKPMDRHLLEYFAAEMGIGFTELPSLDLVKPWRPKGVPKNYITIHPMAGWSIYKNWSMQRWEKVIAELKLPVYQLGGEADYRLKGADHSFLGSVDQAAALIANATLHLGVDSYTNHLTHIKWGGKRTPAIILWGSTQSSASGYDHNVNISANLPCQPCFRENPKISTMPRGVCDNPPEQTYEAPRHACMTQITPEMVLAEIKKLLKR